MQLPLEIDSLMLNQIRNTQIETSSDLPESGGEEFVT